jgi:hypothetical protein
MAQFYTQVKLIFKRSTKAGGEYYRFLIEVATRLAQTEARFFLDKNKPPLIYKKAKSLPSIP